MERFVFLSKEFFEMSEEVPLVEIERKQDRPYILLLVTVAGRTWGLPLRSNIRHPYAFWTDKPNRCGVDYSKAVLIDDPRYIDHERRPHIRDREFRALKGSEHAVRRGFEAYARSYAKARRSGHPRYDALVRYSTLQNYEDVLGIEGAGEA